MASFPRHRRATALALDLGTSRTRLAAPDGTTLLDEPTLVAFDRRGNAVAAGWAAWRAASAGPARLCRPVRRGRVEEPARAVQLLRLLLAQARVPAPSAVAVGVPAPGRAYDAGVLRAVVASATGADVTVVDSLLAAAAGTEAIAVDDKPELLLDVGAGLVEVGAVGAGYVTASVGAPVGAGDYLDQPETLLRPLCRAVQSVLDGVPPTVAGDLVARPARLVGGGTLLPGLVDGVAAACRLDMHVPPDPRDVVVGGLARCLPAPERTLFGLAGGGRR
ncbi:rod shape-determining protein [Motilibacter deserti]|uniref:Rod shape-determining protein MreB n=1 Tax=Motilibacter deserti TaxID=2714956 RepID=A0ABX0GVU0_9ACTN|nr:hypothetical protein [Motilibacter deserti]